MKNPWIFPAAALVIGGAAGFISGRNTSGETNAAALQESAQRTRSTNRPTTAEESGKRTARAGTPDEIQRLASHSSRVQALLDFYSKLSPAQLEEEAKKLENLPMNERIMSSLLLFGRWAEVDPTAAMAFSNTMGFAGAFTRPTILQSWASSDPASAAKYFTENPGQFAMMNGMGGRGQSGAGIIAAEWARQDPEGALAWTSSLERDKGQAMTSVIAEIAKKDPRKAADLVSKMDAADQAGAYSTIATQWGATNFNDTRTWITTLPVDQQDGAMARAISGLASSNPAQAANETGNLKDGREKERAVEDVTRNLVRDNPTAALAYVNVQPQGKVRDVAIRSYVSSNATANPTEALSLAETIGDERDRGMAIASVTTRMEPAAAKSYIEESTAIPQQMKERLLRGGGGWGGRNR